MKSNFLSRLHRQGTFYIIAALLLLGGIPLYQQVILNPSGYNTALNASGTERFITSLLWIHQHTFSFLLYRLLLLLAFALLLAFPFTLFRIIVAQELMGQQEQAEQSAEESESTPEGEEQTENDEDFPPYPWRGKGFAIIAAWAGLAGLVLYLLGTAASTFYQIVMSANFTAGQALPTGFEGLSGFFSILTNTAGIGLLAVATLFFGAVIARSGMRLWPGIWVAFGYTALAITALLSGSAVAVASAPNTTAVLTTPALLLFALWILWLGILLVRLKPEP